MLEEKFFRILFDRIENIDTLMPDINRAADAIIEAVTHGGRMMVYDERSQLSQESNYRCAGLRLPRPAVTPEGDLMDVTPLDVVVIYSHLPATEKSLRALDKARTAGSWVVAVCPKTRNGKVPDGPTLAVQAHLHIDDLSDAGGTVRPPGWKNAIAPTTAIMNDVILWVLHGQIIDRMTARGVTPGVLRGGHLKGGSEFNHAVVDSLFNARGW